VRKVRLATLAVAMVSCVPLARANMVLSQNLTSGIPTICVNSPFDTGPAQCVPFANGTGATVFGFQAQSNSPGTSSDTHLFGSALEIINTGSATISFTLFLGTQNFMLPTGPVLFSSEIGITSTTGSSVLELTSCVDPTGALPPPSQPGLCGGGGPQDFLTNPLQSVSGASSAQNTVSKGIASLSPGYSLNQSIQITLGAGADINFSTSAILASVPEPASTLSLGGGLVAIAMLIRKRFAGRS
jgi:hypothetical protein